MARVVLAMSGGVDSSVAAHLLKEQGHEVIGLFMRTGSHGDQVERRAKTCCSATDSIDARSVADRLDIPFYALDFEQDFERIIENFADEYIAGRTPNPCVLCNIWLKFGKLWSYGKQVGADFVATGHYARLVQDVTGHNRVARGIDGNKDQSYVLFGLRRELLNHVMLPVGGFTKSEIRELARTLELPVHNKVDSQEICFIPDDDYLRFIREKRPERETAGVMVDEAGKKLRDHEGIEGFTIGQRKGLGIALGEPRYVYEIQPTTNVVKIGPKSALERIGLAATRFNWQSEPIAGPFRCHAQIRAQHTAVPAIAKRVGDEVHVKFDDPQYAVTPGQIVTLYEGDMVIGGGWIDRPNDETSL